jgi:multiple sugar transport system ATP-binding protein
VRPENFELATYGAANAVNAVVDVSEMMGSEIYMHETACEKDCVVRVATADLPTERRNGFPLGEKVGLTLNGARVHIFDRETQNNILFKE